MKICACGCGKGFPPTKKGRRFYSKACWGRWKYAVDPEPQRKANRKYLEANREQACEKARKRYADDAERRRADARKRYADDPEPKRKASHKWQRDNPERVRKNGRRRYMANREHILEERRKHRAANHEYLLEYGREYSRKRKGQERELRLFVAYQEALNPTEEPK